MSGESAEAAPGGPPSKRAEGLAGSLRDLPGELGVKPSGRVHIPESLGEGPSGGVSGEAPVADPVFTCKDVSVFYGAIQALKEVTIDIGRRQVLSCIGKSG